MAQPVKCLFNEWLDSTQLEDSSKDLKLRALRKFIAMFGDIDVSQVDYRMAEAYKIRLVAGRTTERGANTYLRNFKPFWGWLVDSKYLIENPFKKIALYRVGEQIFPMYEMDEIFRILEVADINWRVMVLIAVANGLREGEILNLTVRELLFDKELILLTPKKDTKETWEYRMKNNRQAYVDFPEKICGYNLHRLVIDLIDQRPNQPYFCVKPDFYRRMFDENLKSNFRNRLTPWGNFVRDWHNLQKRAGMKVFKRFHDLRSGYAHALLNGGADLSKIQDLMRHASLSSTVIYLKRFEKQKLVAESRQITQKYYLSKV